jgi:lactoylglutathione lyase
MASETKKTSISSYLPADTYNSLKPGDGDLTFLHTMLRVRGLARVSVHCWPNNNSCVLSCSAFNPSTKLGTLIIFFAPPKQKQVNDLDKTIDFFKALGLMETRRKESEKGKFTLVFMASAPGGEDF